MNTGRGNAQRKFYVTSGEVRAVVMAEHGMSACAKALRATESRKAMESNGNPFGIELDEFFFVDERGFKEEEAKFWVPMDDFVTCLSMGEV